MPRLWVQLEPYSLRVISQEPMEPASRIKYTALREGILLNVEIHPRTMMTEGLRRSIDIVRLGILPNLVRWKKFQQILDLDTILQLRGLREITCPESPLTPPPVESGSSESQGLERQEMYSSSTPTSSPSQGTSGGMDTKESPRFSLMTSTDSISNWEDSLSTGQTSPLLLAKQKVAQLKSDPENFWSPHSIE